MTSKTVAIEINQNKLMANLEFSFSSSKTVLGELMQNARRAGATNISFVMFDDSDSLLVTDDGKGIDNFQNLFSVATSGWDADVVQSERPFGMGFLSCLYACKSISILSNGSYVEGSTAEILAGVALEVKPIPKRDDLQSDKTYTIISLDGFKLQRADLENALTILASGFPIPVSFNGSVLENSFALSNDFIEIEGIGHIQIPKYQGDLAEMYLSRKAMNVYLQGLPVYQCDDFQRSSVNFRHDTKVNVIHLDSSIYTARMPDREGLHNEKDVVTSLQVAVDNIHLNKLKSLHASLDKHSFAKKEIVKYALSFKGGLEFICHEDILLSGYFFGKVSDKQPSCYSYDEKSDKSATADMHLSFEDIQNGKVKFAHIEGVEDYDDEPNTAAWIYARAKGFMLLDYCHQNPEQFNKHWVHQFKHFLNNDNITVEVNNAGKSGPIIFDSWNNSCEVVLCESYEITYTDKNGVKDSVIIEDQPLYTSTCQMLIPSKLQYAGDAVFLGCSYQDEDDDLEEVHCDKDKHALDLFVQMMRSGDEVSALQGLLNTINLDEYRNFVGQKYELSLDANCKIVLNKIAA